VEVEVEESSDDEPSPRTRSYPKFDSDEERFSVDGDRDADSDLEDLGARSSDPFRRYVRIFALRTPTLVLACVGETCWHCSAHAQRPSSSLMPISTC